VAPDPDAAVKADRDMHEKLKSGLVGGFPASDPPSAAQPAPSRHDQHLEQNVTLWRRITGLFR